MALIVAVAYFAGLAAATLLERLPPWILVMTLALSLFAFALYRHDKQAARKGEWRVSEGSLHLIVLLGGWPGALVAQQRLRHKTRKASFLLVFWLTAAVHVAAVASWAIARG